MSFSCQQCNRYKSNFLILFLRKQLLRVETFESYYNQNLDSSIVQDKTLNPRFY
jgi:hypothetical protein